MTTNKVKYGKNVVIHEPVNIYGNVILGDDVMVGVFTEIQPGSIIGDRTRVQSHIYVAGGTIIGKDCFIGHGVMFTNDKFTDGKLLDLKVAELDQTIIGDNVIIGSNSTLLPVNVASGIVIGAGSVVTKDLTKKGIYVGNPARLIREL